MWLKSITPSVACFCVNLKWKMACATAHVMRRSRGSSHGRWHEDRRKMEERKTDLYSMWKVRKKTKRAQYSPKCTPTKVVLSIKVVRSRCKGISSKSPHRTSLGGSEFDAVAGDAYPLVFDADAVRRRVAERADELFQVISRFEE